MSSCIIDNWSLEHAGFLLDKSNDIISQNEVAFQNNLGGLSNYINALLLYEKSNYLKNGFEDDWMRFEWFEKNTSVFFNKLDPSSSNIDWNSEASYADNGIGNYLIISELFSSDLFISPERASKLVQANSINPDDNFISTLKKIDASILHRKDESWYKNIQIGIEDNFQLPALTQYVLSQASSVDDLLTVIMQLKSDGKIQRIRHRVNELNSSTKSSMKLQKEIENIISDSFGLEPNYDRPWSIKISILFLSLTKSFGLDFFNRKEHLVFLKDIAGLRAENKSLNKHLARIFNRSINPLI